MGFTYAKAGVDIKKMRGVFADITHAVRTTHNKSVIPLLSHYAGLFKLGKSTLAFHTDGVGTKVLVAQKVGRYDTIGIDCIAMNVNDLVCVGARPLAFVDYIALEREDKRLVGELMKGLVKGAREAEVAIVGGETAIMPDVIKGFDLAGSCIGVVDGKLITGERMRVGDVVVGLESSGIHSNGLTLARKVLDVEKWGNELLTPTKIYVKPVLEMVSSLDVHGIAHITGGAFSKLMRIGDRAKVGFLLNQMPEPPKIFKAIQHSASISEYEMYRTFNMGIGMCVVVPQNQIGKALGIARKFGVRAKVIGKIVKERKVVVEKGGRKITLT